MRWLVFLVFYVIAAALAPKVIGYGSLLLVGLLLIRSVARLFSHSEEEGEPVATLPEAPAAAPTAFVPVPSPQAPLADGPALAVAETDEEFLARQRAANFSHDPSH
jgi:hypothetical protein